MLLDEYLSGCEILIKNLIILGISSVYVLDIYCMTTYHSSYAWMLYSIMLLHMFVLLVLAILKLHKCHTVHYNYDTVLFVTIRIIIFVICILLIPLIICTVPLFLTSHESIIIKILGVLTNVCSIGIFALRSEIISDDFSSNGHFVGCCY